MPIPTSCLAAAAPAPTTLGASSIPRAACGARLACSLSGTCVDIAALLRTTSAQEKSPIDRHGRFGILAQCEVAEPRGPFSHWGIRHPDKSPTLYTNFTCEKSSNRAQAGTATIPNIFKCVLG